MARLSRGVGSGKVRLNGCQHSTAGDLSRLRGANAGNRRILSRMWHLRA